MIRLKLPAIEQKPKKVIVAPTWRDPAGIARDPVTAKTLLHMRKCMENGAPLPSTYYSKRAGTTVDALLEAHGIMHLHLGRWTTRELLWVVQYADRVVWLELSDHGPFSTQPPGRNLLLFHRTTFGSQDASEPLASTARGFAAVKIELRTKGETDEKADDD